MTTQPDSDKISSMCRLDSKFELGELFPKIEKQFRKIEDVMLAEYQLSHFHAMYIANLHRNNEMTLMELTETIGVDKANTTRVVRDLFAKGYIEKIGEKERKFKIKLSTTGQEIADKFKLSVEEFIKKIFKDFTDEEKSTFYHLIDKLYEGVKNA